MQVTSLVKFLGYLGSARSTLDIAVFNITCNEIADSILTLKNNGISVRRGLGHQFYSDYIVFQPHAALTLALLTVPWYRRRSWQISLNPCIQANNTVTSCTAAPHRRICDAPLRLHSGIITALTAPHLVVVPFRCAS